MTKRMTESKLNARHRQILELAKQQGFLSTETLARTFDVTTQTIRRDINMLCDEGLMRRFHGGAGPASSVENVDYSSRQVLNHEAKIRIAKAVVEQIPDNASLFINIGTTTEEVAKALEERGLFLARGDRRGHVAVTIDDALQVARGHAVRAGLECFEAERATRARHDRAHSGDGAHR